MFQIRKKEGATAAFQGFFYICKKIPSELWAYDKSWVRDMSAIFFFFFYLFFFMVSFQNLFKKKKTKISQVVADYMRVI